MAEQAQPLDFPAVLNFLHAEWRRFERERTEWELECADLKVFIQDSRRFHQHYFLGQTTTAGG